MARKADNRFWNESAGATFDGRHPTTVATNDNRHVETMGLCVHFALQTLCVLCVETTSFNAKIAKGLDAEKRKVEIEWLRILDVERLQEVA